MRSVSCSGGSAKGRTGRRRIGSAGLTHAAAQIVDQLRQPHHLPVQPQSGLVVEGADAVLQRFDLGAHRVIVGTETLTGPDALDRLLAELPEGALVLSVDLRDGRLLSPDAQLAGLGAMDAVARLHRAGLREAIVLDLARVGSGAGPDVALIAEIHGAFPDLDLLAGGGVRTVDDLRALDAAGAAGALVATALHNGVIGPRELAELR